ncbi:MAG: 4Fe-4S single cluster domain of Ferredoxin [Solirubrobacteraceae bacterium]|jgi:ferredoxin|nr:4Fe-4S single cluster domain of Ferredoxin [Solirubrobacteraceae bacterium]
MGRSLEVAVAPSCISSGYCRNSAPDVFGEAANRKSMVKANPIEESDVLWEAMEGCPVEAISAKDAETGDIVFPED